MRARLEKLRSEVKECEKTAFQEALARKARNAEIERQIAKVSNSWGTSFRSISPDESFTEDSGWIDKTETLENSAKSNIAVSVHSKSENAVKLVHEGEFSAPMRDSKPLTEADDQTDRNDRTKAECSRTEHVDEEQHHNQTWMLKTKEPRSSSQRNAYRTGQKQSL